MRSAHRGGFWRLKATPRLGVPSVMVTDAPTACANRRRGGSPIAERSAGGRGVSHRGDELDEALLAEAEALAKGYDVVMLMVGLPDSYESEGFDRTHMRLPESHLALIRRVILFQIINAL